jgi:hypothetical protein
MNKVKQWKRVLEKVVAQLVNKFYRVKKTANGP